MSVSSGRGRRGFLAALAGVMGLATLGSLQPAAEARGRTRFLHRVRLQSGAATKVLEVEVGAPQPRVRKPSSAGWWRPSPGGREPELRVKVDKTLVRSKPAGATATLEARGLVISADEKDQLWLPSPDAGGDMLWFVRTKNILVVAWSSDTEERIGIDLARGRVIWRRPAPGSPLLPSPGGAAAPPPSAVPAARIPAARTSWSERAQPADGGRVLVHSARHLEALDAATGDTLWRVPRDARDSSPTVEVCGLAAARWVVAISDVIMLDAPTGAVRWRARLGPGQARWCLTDGDRILVAWRTGSRSAGSEQNLLAAIGAADGRILWKTVLDDAPALGAVVGRDGLAIWSPRGIARVDPRDGRVLWTLADVSPTAIEPLTNGDWFLPYGGCARIDSRTGTVLWRLGGACRRHGEDLLLVAGNTRHGMADATISLRQYSFARQRLLREDPVFSYKGFFDEGAAQVIDSFDDTAVIESEFITLE